ncbi:hypothetical protein [Polaribacter sp. IC063]|nr:hypothetical protein [Polaribacter sp. IC063]
MDERRCSMFDVRCSWFVIRCSLFVVGFTIDDNQKTMYEKR